MCIYIYSANTKHYNNIIAMLLQYSAFAGYMYVYRIQYVYIHMYIYLYMYIFSVARNPRSSYKDQASKAKV